MANKYFLQRLYRISTIVIPAKKEAGVVRVLTNHSCPETKDRLAGVRHRKVSDTPVLQEPLPGQTPITIWYIFSCPIAPTLTPMKTDFQKPEPVKIFNRLFMMLFKINNLVRGIR